MTARARSPSTASTTAGFDAAVRRPRPPPPPVPCSRRLRCLSPQTPGGGLGPKPGGLGRGQARGGPVPRQSGPLAGPRPAPAALSTQPKGRRRLPLPPASRWARGEGAAAGRGEEREHRATCDRVGRDWEVSAGESVLTGARDPGRPLPARVGVPFGFRRRKRPGEGMRRPSAHRQAFSEKCVRRLAKFI